MWSKNFFSRREPKEQTPSHRRTKSSDSNPQSPKQTSRADGTSSAPPKPNGDDNKMSFVMTPGGLRRTDSPAPPIEEQFALLRQHSSAKAIVGQYIGLQEHNYRLRYRDLPHAQRTRDLAASLKTIQAINFSLPSSQNQIVLRSRSTWELRKRMLIDSVAYKDHIWSIREKHGGGLERDNVLLHFVALLVEEGGEIEWPEEILKRREWNCERKQPLESTEGLVYSLSGPGVRKKRLVEAEARLGIRGLEFGGVKRRVALRPELRLSIKKSTSMEAMVGGTPRNNHEMSIESPCSDDDEREDAHIDSLRLALAAMSHHSPPAPSRTSTNNFALASAIAPTPDSARDKASWEPISALDQQQEELDRQRSREESRGEEWGTDSEGSNGSEDIDDETNGGKRREEEIEEARKLAGNGERVKKKERTSSEKEKEKTSIAESFPGRSFF